MVKYKEIRQCQVLARKKKNAGKEKMKQKGVYICRGWLKILDGWGDSLGWCLSVKDLKEVREQAYMALLGMMMKSKSLQAKETAGAKVLWQETAGYISSNWTDDNVALAETTVRRIYNIGVGVHTGSCGHVKDFYLNKGISTFRFDIITLAAIWMLHG